MLQTSVSCPPTTLLTEFLTPQTAKMIQIFFLNNFQALPQSEDVVVGLDVEVFNLGLDVEVFNFVVEGLGGLGLVEVDLYPVVDFWYVGYTALSEDVTVGVVDLE